MVWKALVVLCLVFFAATLITSAVNTPIVSLKPLWNALNLSDSAILDIGVIEPMGDPIDDPAAPK